MENLLENSFIVWMNNGYDNYDSFMYDKTKQCKTCGNIYNLNNFRKQKESTDGFGIYCKICLKDKYNKSLLNKEYKIRLAKQRHDNHIKNKDKYNKKHRDNYQANKDKINIRRKKYYENNPMYRMAENCRVRIRELIHKKTHKTYEYLDCDRPFLIEWIQFQLNKTEDMNFDNYCTYWHIDHVIPCACWDLTNIEHIKKCFHWSNLSPLQSTQNIIKNDKIEEKYIEIQNKELQEFTKIKNINNIILEIPNTSKTEQMRGVPKVLTTAD